jgi:hypothetical protein
VWLKRSRRFCCLQDESTGWMCAGVESRESGQCGACRARPRGCRGAELIRLRGVYEVTRRNTRFGAIVGRDGASE